MRLLYRHVMGIARVFSGRGVPSVLGMVLLIVGGVFLEKRERELLVYIARGSGMLPLLSYFAHH